jgi:ribosome biogenesis GTPase A
MSRGLHGDPNVARKDHIIRQAVEFAGYTVIVVQKRDLDDPQAVRQHLRSITKAKKRLKKELGITAALKPFRAWTNAKRRFKRKIGYESEAGRLIRNGFPRLGGCLVVPELVSHNSGKLQGTTGK